MSNGLAVVSQRGRGKNKVFWTDEEVKALVESLKELAYDPLWKTEGGFKSNYMCELRSIILSRIPNFSKQVSPHMESKLKWLKNRYFAISKMLGQSGCQWNAAESMIRCERQWYDNWVKKHKEARGLWNMKFPYFEALDVVYGLESLDRDNEEVEEGFEDDFKSIVAYDQRSSDDEGDDEANSDTQDTDGNTATCSDSRKQKRQTSSTEKDPKKVKTSAAAALAHSPNAENVGITTGKFELILDHLATIATSMANEDKRAQLVADRSNNVVKELIKLGLANGDVFRAADIFCEQPSKLTVFFQLPLRMRRQYVNYLFCPASSPVLGSRRS